MIHLGGELHTQLLHELGQQRDDLRAETLAGTAGLYGQKLGWLHGAVTCGSMHCECVLAL